MQAVQPVHALWEKQLKRLFPHQPHCLSQTHRCEASQFHQQPQDRYLSPSPEDLLYRILDIKSSRTLWQKIFGVGTITLYNADKSDGVLKLENIKDPNGVRRYISDLVEKQRKANGVAGREIIGSNGCAHGGVDEQDG